MNLKEDVAGLSFPTALPLQTRISPHFPYFKEECLFTGYKRNQDVYHSKDEWKCIKCGVKKTPCKRKGPDGKRNYCNTCFLRIKTEKEKSERGSARMSMLDALAKVQKNSSGISKAKSPNLVQPKRRGQMSMVK